VADPKVRHRDFLLPEGARGLLFLYEQFHHSAGAVLCTGDQHAKRFPEQARIPTLAFAFQTIAALILVSRIYQDDYLIESCIFLETQLR
jgi:hypothetical protein